MNCLVAKLQLGYIVNPTWLKATLLFVVWLDDHFSDGFSWVQIKVTTEVCICRCKLQSNL